jgi:protein-glutamine gamma-glutamyltransferase
MPESLSNTMKQRQLSTHHLQWLLVSLGIVLALHVTHLPPWVIIISASFGVWRYLLDKKHWALPKIRVLIPMTIIICLALLLSFAGSFGRDASISLLVLMCAMKLLETKTLRDYMLIIALAYFLIGSTFIFNQGINTFLASFVPLMLLTATLIQASLPQTLRATFVLKLAGKMLLQAIPLMLVLFILFPRLPGPIWGMSKDAYSGMTGLNDQIALGDVGKLTRNSSVAFRVQFNGDIPSSNQLYWRGPVLWHHNKNKWLTNDQPNLKPESLITHGSAIDYTITLEPHNRLWLLMLDMPTSLPDFATLRHDYTAVAKAPIRTRTRYQVSSHSQYTLGQTLDAQERKMALSINPKDNPQTIKLARGWSNLPPEQIVGNALRLFNQQPFTYTLNPPPLYKHAVDDFLFKTQKGFCEHYASSFVYLMRAAGVPARIITGYQGGELNPNGNYLIVRQSDAHAWSEVWLQDKGWLRVDPTAAVAPDRIEKGIEEAIAELDELPMMVRGDYRWIKNAYLNWDNININWNQWVLGYDNQRQLDFLKKLSGKDLTLNDIAMAMITAILLAIFITAALVLRKQSTQYNQIERLYAQYLKKLKLIGLQPAVGEGALSFAQRAALTLPEQAALILEIAALYNQLTFSQQEKPELVLEYLKDRIQTFKSSKP